MARGAAPAAAGGREHFLKNEARDHPAPDEQTTLAKGLLGLLAAPGPIGSAGISRDAPVAREEGLAEPQLHTPVVPGADAPVLFVFLLHKAAIVCAAFVSRDVFPHHQRAVNAGLPRRVDLIGARKEHGKD